MQELKRPPSLRLTFNHNNRTHFVVWVGALAFQDEKESRVSWPYLLTHVPSSSLRPSSCGTTASSSISLARRRKLTVSSDRAGMVPPPGTDPAVVCTKPPAVGVAEISARLTCWTRAGCSWAEERVARARVEERRVRASIVPWVKKDQRKEGGTEGKSLLALEVGREGRRRAKKRGRGRDSGVF